MRPQSLLRKSLNHLENRTQVFKHVFDSSYWNSLLRFQSLKMMLSMTKVSTSCSFSPQLPLFFKSQQSILTHHFVIKDKTFPHLIQRAYLEELEKTLTLLCYKDLPTCPVRELLPNSQWFKTAAEVDAAIVTSQTGEKCKC